MRILEPGEGDAIRLMQGQRLRIIQIDGSQVVDTWALATDDMAEHLSMEHTRTALSKLVPGVGDGLYSSRRRPLLTLSEDTSPGIHDTLLAACDPERYRQLGGADSHANCADNYRQALAELGIAVQHVPSPLNLFMNIPWTPNGGLSFAPSPAEAGQFVTLTAAIDVIVVASVCPMDLNPINRGTPTRIGIETTSSR